MRYLFYKWLMTLAHKYNWHHATVCYPDGDTLFWCQWCGMRDVMVRGPKLVCDPNPVQVTSCGKEAR